MAAQKYVCLRVHLSAHTCCTRCLYAPCGETAIAVFNAGQEGLRCTSDASVFLLTRILGENIGGVVVSADLQDHQDSW